jgi:ribosomal protein L22
MAIAKSKNTNTDKKVTAVKQTKAVAKKVAVKKTETPVVQAPVKVEAKLVKHQNKNVMISPRKLRLLADVVRKMRPVDALTRLKLTNTKAARIFVKTLKNTIADAKNNFGLNPETLKFESLRVDEGLKIKNGQIPRPKICPLSQSQKA